MKKIILSFLLTAGLVVAGSASAADLLKPLDTAVNGTMGADKNKSGIVRSQDPCDRARMKLKDECQQPRYKVRRDGVLYRNGRIIEEKQ